MAAPHESTLKNTNADKQKTPKNYHLVYFFGSHNFAWMAEDTMKPYEEFKDENIKKGKKTAAFKLGLKQIEEYIANGGKATLSEPPAKSAANEDIATSPSAAGDSLSNDASNFDGKYSICSPAILTISIAVLLVLVSKLISFLIQPITSLGNQPCL